MLTIFSDANYVLDIIYSSKYFEVFLKHNEEIKIMENLETVSPDLLVKVTFTIIVNARKHLWKQKEISFDEVVKLAFGTISEDPNIVYTVIYKRGPKENPEGSMVKGDTVKIKNEMVFNATLTDKS